MSDKALYVVERVQVTTKEMPLEGVRGLLGSMQANLHDPTPVALQALHQICHEAKEKRSAGAIPLKELVDLQASHGLSRDELLVYNAWAWLLEQVAPDHDDELRLKIGGFLLAMDQPNARDKLMEKLRDWTDSRNEQIVVAVPEESH